MPLTSPGSSPTPAAAPGRRLQRGSLILLGLAVMGVLAVALAALLTYPTLPDTAELSNYRPKQPLRVLTADGVEIAGFGAERRLYQRIDQIPKLMKDSLLAVEDARFYSHFGVDPIGVARAAASNLIGRHTQGASTITQQVARTFFLDRSRSLWRKFREALLAFKIERQLTKDQVLELYMNQIYLGSHAYGFEAAAQAYFGKRLAALSAAECAMLAGLPQNPYYANPIRNYDRAMARQRVVLARMHATGVIDDIGYIAAKEEKLTIRRATDVDVHGEYVAEMARQQVFAQFGELSYTTGLTVTTTLRAAEQQAAWRALRRTLMEHEQRQPWRGPEGEEKLDAKAADDHPSIAQALSDYDDDDDLKVAIVTRVSPKEVGVVLSSGAVLSLQGPALRQAQPGLSPKAPDALRLRRGSVVRVTPQGKSWLLTQWPEAEGAMVALDPRQGEIRAMVGGFDFQRNQFNHVTQGWRQPGSSYKPFLYAAAMENGVMPQTIVNDMPLTGLGDWDPANSDGSTDGPISVRQGLAKSKNLVTIRLAQLLGPVSAREWTTRYGFEVDKHPDNLTLALGTGSTTPLQLAGAYAVIANGGFRVTPVLIQRITNAKGEAVFEAPKPAEFTEETRAVPERNTFMTASLLQEVTRSGTAARAQAQLKRTDLYGKTGTTDDVVDAWFAGFHPSLVATVWIGYDKPRSLGNYASGSSLALPAWIDFMTVALKGVPVKDIAPVAGVVNVEGDWRYSEWADGSFIRSLGLDERPINRSLIPAPPVPGTPGGQVGSAGTAAATEVPRSAP